MVLVLNSRAGEPFPSWTNNPVALLFSRHPCQFAVCFWYVLLNHNAPAFISIFGASTKGFIMASAKRNTRRKVKATPLNSAKPRKKTGRAVNLPFAQAPLRFLYAFDSEQAARKNNLGKPGKNDKTWTKLTFEEITDHSDHVDRDDQDRETLHGSNSTPNKPARRITVWMPGEIRGRGPNPKSPGDRGYLTDEVRERLAMVCNAYRGAVFICDGRLVEVDTYGDQRQDTAVLSRIIAQEVKPTVGMLP